MSYCDGCKLPKEKVFVDKDKNKDGTYKDRLLEAIRKAKGDEPTGKEIEQDIKLMNKISSAMRRKQNE
jgi:hypothetical protein